MNQRVETWELFHIDSETMKLLMGLHMAHTIADTVPDTVENFEKYSSLVGSIIELQSTVITPQHWVIHVVLDQALNKLAICYSHIESINNKPEIIDMKPKQPGAK